MNMEFQKETIRFILDGDTVQNLLSLSLNYDIDKSSALTYVNALRSDGLLQLSSYNAETKKCDVLTEDITLDYVDRQMYTFFETTPKTLAFASALLGGSEPS